MSTWVRAFIPLSVERPMSQAAPSAEDTDKEALNELWEEWASQGLFEGPIQEPE